MTPLLAHPTDEDLGRFVEGTLPDTERREVVAHIADCDECRILVVDSAEFIEPAKTESTKWWMAIAASLILALAIGGSAYWRLRDPLAPVIEATSQLTKRPVEPRLAGFSYIDLNRMRGDAETEIDAPSMQLQEKIADVIERRGDDPKTLHAKGIAYLLAAATATEPNEVKSDRTRSIAALQAAADREPGNVAYLTDLAAALLVTGDKTNRNLALGHLDKALSLDPRNPDALFNRALALRDSNSREALAAFNQYLAVDSSSKWADEARQHRDGLLPPPP